MLFLHRPPRCATSLRKVREGSRCDSRSSGSKRLRRLALVLCAQGWLSAGAVAQVANESSCVDRLAAELAQTQAQAQAQTQTQAQIQTSAPTIETTPSTTSVALRLPNLNYSCLRLSNGRHVWVGEAGSEHAATVLLVHGLGNNAHRDWRASIAALAPKFRVLVVDLPGFGASESLPQGYSFDALASVLAEVLDRYRANSAHVVGHSLGGALSLYFAHVRPQRVERLVLVDAAGILHRSVFVRHMVQVQLSSNGSAPADRLLALLDRRINDLSRLLLQRLDDGFDFSDWLMDNPAVRIPLLGSHTQVDAAVGLVEHNFAPAIRAIAAPTTLIWGAADPIAPIRSGEMLVARMRDARIHVLASTGHVPMTESTREFNVLLLAALSEPVLPKFNGDAPNIQYGDVTCANQSNARFTGYFASLTLKNCAAARIEFARIGKLILEDSSATLSYTSIASDGAALIAERSRVTATAVTVRGETAIYAVQSDLDFAGASLRASKRAVESSGNSRLYFSVSDIEAPDFAGDAHFIWSPAVVSPVAPRQP